MWLWPHIMMMMMMMLMCIYIFVWMWSYIGTFVSTKLETNISYWLQCCLYFLSLVHRHHHLYRQVVVSSFVPHHFHIAHSFCVSCVSVAQFITEIGTTTDKRWASIFGPHQQQYNHSIKSPCIWLYREEKKSDEWKRCRWFPETCQGKNELFILIHVMCDA